MTTTFNNKNHIYKTIESRAPGLDLLRATAIAAVMLYHISSHGIAMPAWVEHGWMGVDLFFVLSGYLIGWQVLRQYALGDQPRWGRFIFSRALRVLPAYYAVLALYALLPGWREADGLQPLWKYFTFTLNLFPDWQRGRAYSHAWSLCVEEHFYLLFPIVVWLLARRSRSAIVVAVTISLVGGGMLLRAWLWQHEVAPQLDAGNTAAAMSRFVEAIYNPTYARLDGLLDGVVLAALRAFRPGWWAFLLERARLLLMLGLAILACCIRIDGFSPTGAVFLFPLVALGCACLLVGALSPVTWLGRQPLPGTRLVAVLAFSLYLTHREVYGWLDGWLPGLGERAPPVAFFIYCLASLAVAALLYLGIERPGLRLRERWLGTGVIIPADGSAAFIPRQGSLVTNIIRRALMSLY
jgi:peptidoglycan/LPS O-acetylase OafA/YrhL